jgi:heme-degrading monooxygenase HmoA
LSVSSEFTTRLSEDLTLEYVPVSVEPRVQGYPVAERSDDGDPPGESSTMWVRIVSLKILPGKLGDFRSYYAEHTIPALRKVKGCRHVYLLESEGDKDEVLSVTTWQSRQDAEAYERSGLFDQLLDNQKHLLSSLYQWKRNMGREKASFSATSDDVMVEHYVVLTGKSLNEPRKKGIA